MLISHRHSAYVDAAELEYASGFFNEAADAEGSDVKAAFYSGAGAMLRIIARHNVDKPQDLIRVFDAFVFEEPGAWIERKNA